MPELETRTYRLDPELDQFIARAAAELQVTKSEIVAQALRQYRSYLDQLGVVAK